MVRMVSTAVKTVTAGTAKMIARNAVLERRALAGLTAEELAAMFATTNAMARMAMGTALLATDEGGDNGGRRGGRGYK